MADALRTELANASQSEDLGIVPAPVAVLAERFHEPRTARCLLEVGFLTNPEDAALLESNAHRDRVAEAIAQAIRMTFESPMNSTSPEMRLGGAGVQYGDGPVPGLPCSFPDQFPEDFTTVAAMHHVEEQYGVDRRTMSSVRWRRIDVQEWSIILQVNGAEHEFRVLWRSTGHLNVHGLTPPLDRWSCNYEFDCDAHDPSFTLVGCIIRNLTFDRR